MTIAYAVQALELMESLHEHSRWMQQLSKLKQEDWCQQPSWPQALQDILAELMISAGQAADQTCAYQIRACFRFYQASLSAAANAGLWFGETHIVAQ